MSSTSTYDQLLKQATDGLAEIKRMNAAQRKEFHTVHGPFPPAITVRGGQVSITIEGAIALRELGRLWRANDSAVADSLSREAAESLAIQAFGNLLDAADELPGNADVKTEFLKLLEARLKEKTRREYFYYPARIFEQPEVPTFTVGPITFYRRSDWLAAVEDVAKATLPWKQEVLATWEMNEGNTKSSLSRDAERVCKFVGSCEWVASIAIDGRDRSRSEVCASAAVVVALDTLGLPLDAEIAKNFRGPGDAVESRTARGLSQYEGASRLNSSTSFDMPRIGGRPGAHVEFLHDLRKLHVAAGHALQDFVDIIPTGKTPGLMRRWVEAMYWFGQARREKSDFIALVKIGIALDVLARGGKYRGILALACALHDKSDADTITSDGRLLGPFVKKLYDDGRSKIAHGGSLALLQELPLELGLADSFAANILIGYIACAVNYVGSDCYEDFLLAIPTIVSGLRNIPTSPQTS